MRTEMSDKAVVVVGIGELGSLFSRGFLRSGFSVFPVLRHTDCAEVDSVVKKLGPSNPLLVLVAVDMTDLAGVLERIPDQWRDRLVLIQNELLPRHWRGLCPEDTVPSVVVVWLEKKKGIDTKIRECVPEFVYSPNIAIGDAVEASLNCLGIPTCRMPTFPAMLPEMVTKNMLNLVMNIGGLALGPNSTFTELLSPAHTELLESVLSDAATVQKASLDERESDADFEKIKQRVVELMRAMPPDMKCQGRYARKRLERALATAEEKCRQVPKFREIFAGLPP